jgi:group I intron endonuclease
MEYTVYKHTLRADGRVYVGQTCDIKSRWRFKGCEYKDSPHFWNAINKYGWDAFEHEILADKLSKADADRLEDYYIMLYHSMNPQMGFNLKGGGSKGKHSEATRNKISETAKLRVMPCGEKSPMYGKHHSQSTKDKFSEMRKGEKHPRCKKVAQIDKATGEVIKVFPYLRKATEETGVNCSHICSCCKGKRKQAGGYVWKYATENEET